MVIRKPIRHPRGGRRNVLSLEVLGDAIIWFLTTIVVRALMALCDSAMVFLVFSPPVQILHVIEASQTSPIGHVGEDYH